jgi:hypothetical protein
MTQQPQPDANDRTQPATSSPDELVRDLDANVTAEDANTVKGGSRVKTSDKQQAAVLDFVKG